MEDAISLQESVGLPVVTDGEQRRLGIQNFEEASRPFLGIPHALCILRETCGDIVVLEHNGDVYECDHFVTSEHRLGNVRETPLLTLLESSRLRAFGARKRNALLPRARGALSVPWGLPQGLSGARPRWRRGLEPFMRRIQALFHSLRPVPATHGPGPALGSAHGGIHECAAVGGHESSG